MYKGSSIFYGSTDVRGLFGTLEFIFVPPPKFLKQFLYPLKNPLTPCPHKKRKTPKILDASKPKYQEIKKVFSKYLEKILYKKIFFELLKKLPKIKELARNLKT